MFKKRETSKFVEIVPFLKEMFQKDITVAVCDTEKFLAYSKGTHLDFKINVGDLIPNEDPLFETLQSGEVITRVVPESVYGIYFKAVTYPIKNSQGQVIGAVGISEPLDKEIYMSHQLGKWSEEVEKSVDSIEGINKDVEVIAENLEEITSTIEEINANGNVVGETALNIKNMSDSAFKISDEALILSKDSIASISVINQTIDHFDTEIGDIREDISALNQSIDQMQRLTQLINAIAEQTNMLALNASIEAARAGEHGRGFSVVADEVGKLAIQSQNSVKEIHGVIGDISKSITALIERIERTEKSTAEGKKDINSTVEKIKHSLGNMETVHEEIKNISDSIRVQSSATKELAQALESVSCNIEDVAAKSEDIQSNVNQHCSEMKAFENQMKDSIQIILN